MTYKGGLIFVEGTNDSQIINNIVNGLDVTVILAGGKFGQSKFMEGYSQGKAVSSLFRIAFRDRDFDFKMPEQPSLSILSAGENGRIMVSYRITIENYLLLPENYDLLKHFDTSARHPRIDTSEFSNLLMEAAIDIRYYQAARHALGETRQRNELGTSWLNESGILPESLGKEDCITNALKSLSQYAEKANSISNEKTFLEKYEGFCSTFDDQFFIEGHHLSWFQGKDLAKSLTTKLSARIPNFPMNSLYKVAIDNFDYTKFPDLVELRKEIITLL